MTHAGWWIAILAFTVGGFFSTLQMSLRTASRAKARRFAAERGLEGRADAILDRRQDFALAASIVRIVFMLTGVAAFFVWGLGSEGVVTDRWPALALAAALSAMIIYLMGAALPMSLAEHAGEAIVIRSAPLLRVLRAVLAPMIAAAMLGDEIVRRLAGVPELTEGEEFEEEIRSVVSDRSDEGSLPESGRDMIEAVVDFRTTTVEEVMTPRTEVRGITLTNNLTELRDFIAEAGHSRIPVYEENLDHIIGLLYAKDLLKFLGEDTTRFDLRTILREPRFVPENKRLDELLAEFQREKVHIAIVLDEYGGTAGLVTIEDVVEEIVGEIYDEFEHEAIAPPMIHVLEGGRAVVIDGRAYIDDVNDELLSLGAEIPEDEDYDTMGGYVTTGFGHIPVAGECFRHNGFTITVLEAEPTRVAKVRLELTDDDMNPAARPVPVETVEDDLARGPEGPA